MADGIEVRMLNGPELIAQLRALREDVAVTTVRGSVRRIGTFLLQKVQAATPVSTGKLKANIRVASKYVRGRGVVTAKVGVNTRGKRDNPKNAFYWRFVEFGHKTRPAKKAGTQHEVPGKEFITRAYLGSVGAIQQMFYSDLQKAIDRASRKR